MDWVEWNVLITHSGVEWSGTFIYDWNRETDEIPCARSSARIVFFYPTHHLYPVPEIARWAFAALLRFVIVISSLKPTKYQYNIIFHPTAELNEGGGGGAKL